ncbi:MAG: PCYCGC motif-containing (lipo)protein [Dehalococcoidia bacterium]|nr:PCYCGC motif-containing (lipo)protein [Dehalococcoidia bacterium]
MKAHETQSRWAPAIMIAAAAAGLVIVAGLVVLFASGAGSDDGSPAMGVQDRETGRALPEYAMAAGDQAAMAYQFALDRPDVMLWMPCYCGCGGHSDHKNARDCFVKPASSSGDIQFDEHGSTCNVCVDIALRAREMTLAGRPLSEIRAAVDQEFSSIGPGTDTPLPPE